MCLSSHNELLAKGDYMAVALLVIDIQKDYFPGGRMPLVNPESAAIEAKRLLDGFRSHHWPVIFMQHVSLSPTASFFLPDTDGIAIHPLVAPQTGETILVKHYPNSFRETRLLEVLQQLQVAELVISGMMTHMCVDASTRQAFDLGLSCFVAYDATATLSLQFNGLATSATEVQTAFLSALNGTYALVQSAASILASLF